MKQVSDRGVVLGSVPSLAQDNLTPACQVRSLLNAVDSAINKSESNLLHQQPLGINTYRYEFLLLNRQILYQYLVPA